MAESTLNYSLTTLKAELGDFLGIGRDSATWSATDISRVDASIADGLRRFYFNSGHQWSFLRPQATLAFVAADATYDLPDDFGGMAGPMTYDTPTGSPSAIFVTDIGEARIRQLHANSPTDTGRPQFYCIRTKTAPSTSAATRFEVWMYPTPDAVYTARYTYSVLPNTLTSGTNVYPHGLAAHALTIKYAVLVEADAMLNGHKDADLLERKYQTLLAGSVQADARMMSPHSIGRMTDPARLLRRGPWCPEPTSLIVNGQETIT